MKKIYVISILLVLIIQFIACDEGPVDIQWFYMRPSVVAFGHTILISWKVENADVVEIDNGIGKVNNHDILEMATDRIGTITYTLTARNSDHTATAEETIQVARVSLYGTPGHDRAYDIELTEDEGFIMAGIGDGCAYMVKTDKNGNKMWSKNYNGNTALRSVKQTKDGGYIAAGNVALRRIIVIKTDSSGNKIWTKTLEYYSEAYSVIQSSDGSFVIAGHAGNLESGRDVYVVKINKSGKEIWSRTYGGPGQDGAHDIQQTPDGDYIITGYYESEQTSSDVYLIKVDKEGNKKWSRTYGGSDRDYGMAVQITPEGDYVIAGCTLSFGRGARDVYILKTDKDGNKIWSNTIGGPGYEIGESLHLTSDGGFIIAGGGRISLYKADSEGNRIWWKQWGGGYDVGKAAIETADGDYVITGWTYSYNVFGQSDIFIIKTDVNGEQE